MAQELQVRLQINAVSVLVFGRFVAQVTDAALERGVQWDSLALLTVNTEQ